MINQIQQLVSTFNSGKRELGSLHIQRTTEGIYSADIYEHGKEAWETVYFSIEDHGD